MEELLGIYRALTDETRLRILKLLQGGELCVCDLFSALDIIQPKVSFHLGVLKEAKFIKDRKEGRWVHYSIDDSEMFRRFLIFSTLERIPEDSVAKDKRRLEAFLKNKKRQCPSADISAKDAPQRKRRTCARGGRCSK